MVWRIAYIHKQQRESFTKKKKIMKVAQKLSQETQTQINPRKNKGDHYCFYRGKKAIALLNYVRNLVVPNGIG